MQSIQCRTNVYQSSFLPSVVRDWNALPENIRLSPSVSLFKKTLSNKQQVPKHFFHGERKLQILHTRIRTNCSSLNYDLHSKNMSDSPMCACGLLENAKHYLLHCTIYTRQREVMIQSISRLSVVTLSILLKGDDRLTMRQNCCIFDAVHEFIRASKRFNNI